MLWFDRGSGEELIRATLGEMYEDRQELIHDDSEYAPMKPVVDASFSQLWALPVAEIRTTFSS